MKPSGGQSGGRMPPKQPWGRGLGKGSGVRVTPWQWDPGDTPPRGQRLRLPPGFACWKQTRVK